MLPISYKPPTNTQTMSELKPQSSHGFVILTDHMFDVNINCNFFMHFAAAT